MKKRKQRELELRDPFRSLDRILSPISRYEKWKRTRQIPDGSFISEATREVAENIVRIYFFNITYLS